MVSPLPELDFEKRLHAESRVLVVNPLNNFWSYQLSSEISLRSRERTSNVRWLNLGPKTPRECEVNFYDHYSPILHGHVHRNVTNLLIESGIDASKKLLERVHVAASYPISNVADLQTLKINQIPVGRMIFSAIASVVKNTDFELDEIREQLDFFMWHAYESHKIIEDEIRSFKPTLVLTTNDRYIASAMALSLAKQNEIQSSLVYWGKSTSYIEDYSSSLYDGYEWENKIKSRWKNVQESSGLDQESEARVELSRLAQSTSADSLNYMRFQIPGSSVEVDYEFCVFYAQSEYEHSGQLIYEPTERFSSQYEAFEALQTLCLELGIELYLKLHPTHVKQVKRKSAKTLQEWGGVKLHDKVKIIDKDSPIDTLTLISRAKFNVIWTSSVGVECISRGIKPIVLGFPLWLNQDWQLHKWTANNLKDALQDDSRTIDPQILLPYIHYLNSFGVSTRYSNKDMIWNKNGLEVRLWHFTFLGKFINLAKRMNSMVASLTKPG